MFFVHFGGKTIEFDKGKSGIAVASAEKLPGVIDTLIAAVRNGELVTGAVAGEATADAEEESGLVYSGDWRDFGVDVSPFYLTSCYANRPGPFR